MIPDAILSIQFEVVIPKRMQLLNISSCCLQANNADANVRLIAHDPLTPKQFHKIMAQIDGTGQQATV